MATSRRRLRCKLRLHRWRIERNDAGKAYRVCRNCGVEDGVQDLGTYTGPL